MINWVLIQQIVLTIIVIAMFIGGVVALKRVIPEINEIVNSYDDEKKSRDGSRD